MHAVYWIPALVVIPVVGLKLACAVHSVKWERHVLAMRGMVAGGGAGALGRSDGDLVGGQAAEGWAGRETGKISPGQLDNTVETLKSGSMKEYGAAKGVPGVTKTELDHGGELGRTKMSQIEKNELPENDALRALAKAHGLEVSQANIGRMKKGGLTGREANTAFKHAHADLRESVGKEHADRAVGFLFEGSVARPKKPPGEM